MNEQRIEHSLQAVGLADILERVLDKGIVIAGDITISLVEVELLNIRLRLVVASVDRAMSMGINWWQSDPHLNAQARELAEENRLLRARLDRLEAAVAPPLEPASAGQEASHGG
ncbi:gas vesicle protein [Ancylobacter sp.]|uniref:gas vesicle protein n=1 Tax=Ancylobacter sp. TaxID=1872567 RepID=UPI003C7CDD86